MIIVSNTGPLIGLAKIRHLHLLNVLAGAVYIPPRVQIELLAGNGPEAPLLLAALKDAIQVRLPSVLDAPAEGVLRRLDAGEREAIALAKSLPPPILLLLDDRAGRNAAKKLGQPVTGLVGLLLLAKRQALVPAVVPLLENIRKAGDWLSDDIINVAKNLAGE